MEDYGDDLLNDFSSDESELETKEVKEISDNVVLGFSSRVLPQVPQLLDQMEFYANEEEMDYLELVEEGTQNREYAFILRINELSHDIREEVSDLDSIIKSQYKLIFPELETLIKNPVDYVKVVQLIQGNLHLVKEFESQLQTILPNEKVLLVLMAALQQEKKNGDDNDSKADVNWQDISALCDNLLQLEGLTLQLNTFISAKLLKFAPNVTVLIGPIATSQLLLAVGSLKQLAQTPSCNIPSLGMKEMSTTTVSNNVTHNTRRNTGYLYHTPIVQYLPNDVVKQAMRILSGKIVLAARIDLAKGSKDGEIGRKYLAEVESKLEKLLTPPENVGDKALPIPVDKKSKKRGGKRFRKMKERMGMSELRKAQNKMAFGKQEDTIMDSFGEEIGLGMSKGIRGINTNTGAVMSKGLTARLKKLEQMGRSANDLDLAFRESQLQQSSTTDTSERSRKRKNEESDRSANKWLKSMTNSKTLTPQK